MSELRINTSLDNEGQLQLLLAKQAEIQAEQAEIQAQIASLLPSPSHQHHRTPIHKQHHQRRSHAQRSMSTGGATNMARNHSERSDVPTPRQRTFSQQSAPAPSMARINSRGSSSQRSGHLPFRSNGSMPPPLHPESSRDNPVVIDWAASREQPFSSQSLSHQPAQLQRSMSQSHRKPDLEQVLESSLTDLEDVDKFICRTVGTPIVSVSPAIPIPPMNTLDPYPLQSGSFYIPTPSTPTSDSLTTATTLTSSMSRQASLNEHMLESMQLSYSQPSHDQSLYDQVPPFTSSRHSRRSSDEEQSQLLAGAGGASHESPISHSFQFTSSDFPGEKMEKSQSNESTSSLSSTSSSRNVQRLQAQINNIRLLKPKGGSEETKMSRENSSQSMTRLESKDGSSDKVAISSKPYTRPKHDRVFCTQCESHPEGFRGEHELRRHKDREHKPVVKKWVCIEPTDGSLGHPDPVLPFVRCKACHVQKKKYGAYYNAAAHLRRAHFKPKSKGARTKSSSKVEDGEKRGGKGGGDWPPMTELKHWMKEVEEQATDCALTEEELAQQDAADAASDEENIDASFDESLFHQQPASTMISSGNFDNSFADATPILHIYPTAVNINNMYSMQNMRLDLTGASQQSQCMDQSMYTPSSQSSFSNFSPHIYQNDATMTFFDGQSSSLLPQPFDDQLLLAGPDFADHAFFQ